MQFTSAIVFMLSLASVQALPVATPDSVALEARALPALFLKHAAEAITRFGPGVTKTMMHSGVGASKAFQIAKGKGLQTVETTIYKAIYEDQLSGKGEYKDTLAKYCVAKDQFCADPQNNLDDWMQAWHIISGQWAGYARIRTELATIKAGPKPESFFNKDEKPVLQQNHVTIDVDDKY